MPLTLPSVGATSAALQRPEAVVRFGTPGGGGGVGALASAVGGALGVSGRDDPWRRSLVGVRTEAGIAPTVDAAEVDLSADAQAPSFALGDEGSVSLGYGDQGPRLVFTGAIDGVRRQIPGSARLIATNGGSALARLRLNQSYERQSAGDVVRELASRAGIATGRIEAGVSIPFFVIDDRRGAWAHIAELARRSGYIAFFDAEGKLSFTTIATGDPVRTFRYAVDLLSLDTLEAEEEVGAATVWGEGAAGSQGQDAWSWLVKDPAPVTGSAGSGERALYRGDRALRSAEAVGTAASAIVAAGARRKMTGRIVTPGAPEVVVGATIEIADAPQRAINARYLVTAVHHRFTKGGGFLSEIGFCAAARGGGGLAGGLL